MTHHPAVLATGAGVSWLLTLASFANVLPSLSALASLILTCLLIFGWFDTRRKRGK